jgi:hypothetical protein
MEGFGATSQPDRRLSAVFYCALNRVIYRRPEGPVLFHVGTAFVTPTEGQ